jgi:hypothetical protein
MLDLQSIDMQSLLGAVTADRHREVQELVDLAAIALPEVNFVCWHRPVDPSLRRYAAEVLTARALDYHGEVAVADLADWQPDGLPTAAGLPAGCEPAVAAAFVADLRQLAQCFAELTGATRLGARLLRLSGPMCPRFHTDMVGVRLLTTYCGSGTEWLAESEVDRRWLGEAGHGRADSRTGVMRPGAVVREVPEFAVALLKGDGWPGNLGFGAVHRSPRPAGQARLLFSLDVLAQEGTRGEGS